MTVPPLFVNTTEVTLSATTATAEPSPTTTAEDSTGSTRRFCPWCYPEISLSEVGEECNLVLQLHLRHPSAETTRERVPWAILNSDFTVLLDGGLVKRDTPVVVSLGGKGRVQMSGNRIWVGGMEGESFFLSFLFIFWYGFAFRLWGKGWRWCGHSTVTGILGF